MAELKKAFFSALWFVFLTLPIVGVKVNPLEQMVVWRWRNMVLVGTTVFFLTLAVRAWKHRVRSTSLPAVAYVFPDLWGCPGLKRPLLILVLLVAVLFPIFFSSYQTNVMTTALMYVVLGLGLNIVVGLAGLLDLGYVAFYAVGAYSYALLNHHFGLGFWAALPIGAMLAACFGIILGFPVLRLRGDYLAIVTLGFGEIIRLILENWNDFSFGPSGVANIPRPGFFGFNLSLDVAIIYLYYLVLGLVLFTIFVVNRLRDSRIGRAWIALREDEIACQSMGIDKTRTKLTAFALGATWAGLVGVFFAAKTTFINPASFTFMESAIILSVVVLGGMGSTIGVVIAALIFILLPEYLRAFADYRMLIFGAIMVLMMVFRPQGIAGLARPDYSLPVREGVDD
ncbi:MAG: high-affinity branched-chain amino acid ABC transporter permease LivM [Proteobacteria bacterium]|nr:high-affinity branched-chain amino acid ABC transporter permease LivM [Desulfobulbaceae bacterium]MBU4152089.1 high-affinity branched-chain amino acid ABC transporter permease LivM [Pseudomonadota bacterium]